MPLCARFDTVGPLCRSVEDAALLFSVLEQGQPIDLSGASLAGKRLAILETTAFDNIENAPRRAFHSAVERLRGAGALIEGIELPCVQEATTLGPVLFPAEAYGTWKSVIEEKGDLMYPPVRKRFLQGKTIMASEFVSSWQRLDVLRRQYREMTAVYDAVIMPTAPILPPKQVDLLADEDYFTLRNLMALQNTRIANLMGLAGLTLPTGVPSCGLLMQGTREEDLLTLGAAAERALI